MNRKSLILVFSGYVIWGLLPIYWGFLSAFPPLFVLANRIIWAAVFTLLLLLLTRRHRELLAVFKDRRVMKCLIPAALLITLNWGLYIWAVTGGRVLDASLGYFINPLAVFICGVLVFKEAFRRSELLSLIFAAVGVLICTLQVGAFPLMALALALSFAAYSTVKKLAHADGLLSFCVETLIVAPLALLFLLFSPTTAAAYSAATPLELALLVGSGLVTALPMVLYSQGFNHLPLITMGLLQFVAPTLMFFVSIARGEDVLARLGGFAFIWVGLLVFVSQLVRHERKARPAAVEAAEKHGT
ncbi:MAG: EamA family transporter RarD [Bacillota bacterium]